MKIEEKSVKEEANPSLITLNISSFKRIKPYFKEKIGAIILGLLCLISVDLAQLILPRIIKRTIDDLTAFRIDLAGLSIYALYILALAVMISMFRYGWLHCIIGMSRWLEEGLRNQLFKHVQTLSSEYFDKTSTGDLMTRATEDMQHIRMAAGMGLVSFADAVFMGTAAIGFMLHINIYLTLIALIPMPFIAIGSRFFSKRMHRHYQYVQAAFSDMTESVREGFAGIRIIKAYTGEDRSVSNVQNISDRYVARNLKLIRVIGMFSPMMAFFGNLSIAIVLYLGGKLAILTTITPGEFVAFISYLELLTWPMMALGWMINLVQRGRASLDRVETVLQTKPNIEDMPDAVSLKKFSDNIMCDKVSFSYNNRRVLSDVKLCIDLYKTIGIVGPPGAGKTTLLNLLLRIYDVKDGIISIDGIDIRKIKLADLRELIAFVPQEPFLFAGTVRENITFGDKKIIESDLINAVEAASLTETIRSFPNGFETLVGEKGIALSGGQRQRIAIARAIFRKSPILVLDDPISQVDTQTGNAIMKSLRSVSDKRTTIIVSHRLSAIQSADHIITLIDGKITESGSHRDLIKADTYYAKTFRLQELEEAFYGFTI